MTDDEDLLREMVREAERSTDLQVRGMELLEQRAQQALTLSAALLGGGLAMATLAHAPTMAIGSSAFGCMALGGGCNLGAVALLLDATSGLVRPRILYLGPSLGWLAQRSGDPAWTLPAHLRRVLAGLAVAEAHNEALHAHARGRHRQGLVLLVVALVAYALALAFILTPALED